MKLLILILAVAAAAEDSKWSWGDDDDDGKGRTGDNRYIRYSVHENPEDGPNQFRPQYPGPYGPNSRPITPGNGNQVLVGPNGPGGIVGRPDYRPIRPGGDGFDYNSGPVVPGANLDPVLYGPAVPSWIRDDPRFQEFDSCKCSRGFNCPGLKFGSCSRGKQYCCFSSRKYHGGRPGYQHSGGNYHNRPYQNGLPFRPFNSIPPEYYGNGNYHNGNYNGDYSGYDRPYNNYNRPSYGNYGNYGNDGDYDGPYQGPYAPDYSGNYNSYNQGGGFNWQNPYRRRPYDGDFYGRSGSKTKNGNTKTTNDVSHSKPADDSKDE